MAIKSSSMGIWEPLERTVAVEPQRFDHKALGQEVKSSTKYAAALAMSVAECSRVGFTGLESRGHGAPRPAAIAAGPVPQNVGAGDLHFGAHLRRNDPYKEGCRPHDLKPADQAIDKIRETGQI